MRNKPITICLTGAQGVGKSTLARSLYNILGPGFSLIDWSRPTLAATKMGFGSSRDIPNEDIIQWEFQVKALFEQLHAQNSAKGNSIYDRGTYDFLGYLGYKMPWLKGTEKYKLYEDIVLEFGKYDYLFLVPPFNNNSPIDNGVRFLTPTEPVEKEIKQILHQHNINYYNIKATTIKGRLDEILQVLGI